MIPSGPEAVKERPPGGRPCFPGAAPRKHLEIGGRMWNNESCDKEYFVRTDNAKIKGVTITVAGLMLMGAAICAVMAVRVAGTYPAVEMGGIGLKLAGALLIFWGTIQMGSIVGSFKKARPVALILVLLTLGELALAGRNVSAGMGREAFVDFSVILVAYLGVIAMLFIYRRGVYSLSGVLEYRQYPDSALRCRKTWLPSCVAVIAILILQPATGALGKGQAFLFSGILIAGLFLVFFNLCRVLISANNLIIRDIREFGD